MEDHAPIARSLLNPRAVLGCKERPWLARTIEDPDNGSAISLDVAADDSQRNAYLIDLTGVAELVDFPQQLSYFRSGEVV
jgi:hypothetical protein